MHVMLRVIVMGFALLAAACDEPPWVDFPVPDSHFTVSVPKTLEPLQLTVMHIPVTTYMGISNRIGYVVACTPAGELSGHSLPNILKIMSPYVVLTGTLREQHAYFVEKRAVLNLVINMATDTPKTQRTRLLARHDQSGTIRIYIMTAVSRPENETNPAIDRFFESFRPTDPSQQPPGVTRISTLR